VTPEVQKGRPYPTFTEIGTGKPLYIHRTGSNVVNGATSPIRTRTTR
jgi:hypothetical protein